MGVRKPKVLLVSTNSDRAGAPKHIAELIRSEKFCSSFDLSLCVGSSGFLTEVCSERGVNYYVIPEMARPIRPVKDYRAYKKLVSLMADLRPDLIHAHSSKAGVVARMAADKLGIRSIFTAHGWPFSLGIPLFQRLYSLPIERYLAKKTAAIITVSEFDKRLAIKKKIAPAEKLFAIHNGLSDNDFRADPGIEQGMNIIMVARFVAQKNQQILISAMEQVNEDVRLTFVGDGPFMAQSRVQAKSLGLENRIQFLGEIHNVPDVLATAQIFVLASNWEGLPISILEAMRCGLPVIASDVGGVSEAVNHGGNGYLIENSSVEILASWINELALDRMLRLKMGQASRQQYEVLFKMGALIEQTSHVYRDSLSGG